MRIGIYGLRKENVEKCSESIEKLRFNMCEIEWDHVKNHTY